MCTVQYKYGQKQPRNHWYDIGQPQVAMHLQQKPRLVSIYNVATEMASRVFHYYYHHHHHHGNFRVGVRITIRVRVPT